MKPIVGGGPKKVLYTLNTVKRIGFKKSAKALTAKNTCKACGLGMGGQNGGMTNEMGEFPAVCNKSVQAQSTDIQAAIPREIFKHSIDDLRELSAHELEHLGRLDHPIFKSHDSENYYEVSWDWALTYAAKRFSQVEPNRTFFYSSGRSSNESGFLLQLLARIYGTNNVNNCSYYCHQATSIGLGSTIGTGTATVELNDLSGCDLIFVVGANPASNHPRFIHKLKACRDRGGKVIIINPAKEPGLVKFAVPKSAVSLIAGGTEIASLYLQPKIGTDIALFKGIAKSILELGAQNTDFICNFTRAYDEFLDDITNTTWDDITQICGIDKSTITQCAVLYAESENTVFSWGMGMTHHQFGCENVEYIANLALLRGMIGKPFAGLLPLRGHSNVQGIGSIGVKPVLAQEVFDNIEKHLDIKLPEKAGLDTYHALEAASNGLMDCACIVGGNLYAATPNSPWTEESINKIGFKCFLTTTLNQGHLYGTTKGDTLILPVLARDEEIQSTTQESMFNYVRLSDGGIHRLDNTRSEVDILAELGSRLKLKSNINFDLFKNHDTIREAIAHTVPGMDKLKDISIAKKEFHVQQRLMHSPEFKNKDGRAQFVTHPIPKANKQEDEFPYLLASVRSEGQFNSIIYEETDSYRYGAKRNSILMSQADLTCLGLRNGDAVSMMSKYGKMEGLAVQVFDIPAGNVLAYYPEANVLSCPDLDPRSQTPNFKSIPVKIFTV